MDFTSGTGLLAGFLTTVSYYPQLKKCWMTGSTGDLSLKTFVTLATGIAMWIVYGALREDAVIILANGVSLCFLGGILYCKICEIRAQKAKPARR